MPAQDRPVLFFPDEQSFRDWLLTNHAAADGVWLRFAEKGFGRVSLNHAGALRQALCFGWIDGQARGEDAEFWQVGFTPATDSDLAVVTHRDGRRWRVRTRTVGFPPRRASCGAAPKPVTAVVADQIQPLTAG